MGSEDGYLRLWPLDFSSVLLEAGEIADICVPSRGESWARHREGWGPLALVLVVLFLGWAVSYGVRELT